MEQDFPIHQAFPFRMQRNRLAELLTADVIAAAGSASLITPAVMILDRYVCPISLIDTIAETIPKNITDGTLDLSWRSHRTTSPFCQRSADTCGSPSLNRRLSLHPARVF